MGRIHVEKQDLNKMSVKLMPVLRKRKVNKVVNGKEEVNEDSASPKRQRK